MWSGRLHMFRHPGQSDGHCERIDKTLTPHFDAYKYILVL